MTDPFSIVAGTISLGDACLRLGKYLAELNSKRKRIEQEFKDLNQEVEAIKNVNESIRILWNAQNGKVDDGSKLDDLPTKALWQNVGINLKGCQSVIEKLGALVKAIIKNGSSEVTGLRDSVKKAMRKQGKEQEIDEARQQLASFESGLQLSLTLLNLVYTRSSQESTDLKLEDMSDRVETLSFQVQSQLASLQYHLESDSVGSLRNLITATTHVVKAAPLPNKYFLIPRSVSSMYSGRRDKLKQLKADMDSASKDGESNQKRFVIYGIGGSGKTEFCSKFAQDNRQSFWGVFYINANSKEDVKRTYSDLAKFVGREPTEAAARQFFAELDKPWLLIIDNADNAKIRLENVFPGGERGVVLITSRNPSTRVHGTFGEGSYKFADLDEESANELILRTACIQKPWGKNLEASAKQIAQKLSCLPLALVQAGTAVMQRLCTLDTYIKFYDDSLERIRKKSRAAGTATPQQHAGDEEDNMNVYSSYEILFDGLERNKSPATQDAVQLIKLFSFFSAAEIRYDLLLAAVNHPRLQAEHDKKEAVRNANARKSAKKRPSKSRLSIKPPSGQMMKGWMMWVVSEIHRDRSRPVLPDVLRDDDDHEFDEGQLTEALNVLEEASIITCTDRQDLKSYSIHLLVHKWIRKRPQMREVEQAIWCQAASTVLAQAVLIPPLDAKPSAESLRLHLLPHVRHVEECDAIIQTRLQVNRSRGRKLLPVPAPHKGERQVWEMAKFSWVYFQNALFGDAERLQVQVRQTVSDYLLLSHPLGRLITLALANTYWHQMRTSKAAELQKEVIDIHDSSLEPDDPQLFKDMDLLGSTRCYQARFHESRELHEKALKELTRLLGPDDEETLGAVDNLGRVMWRYMEYDESRRLHERAVEGFSKCENIGPTHEKTLFAKECQAISYIDILGSFVRPTDERPHPAYKLMIEVLEGRRRKLGREQPWTLLAEFDLARVKHALGEVDEAEQMLRETLIVGSRVLGDNHFGIRMGRTHLAQMVSRQQRYEEAEQMFLKLIHPSKDQLATVTDDGEHPDRILAMWYLVKCYEGTGRYADALSVCRGIKKLLAELGGQGLGPMHPFEKKLDLRIESLGIAVERKEQPLTIASEASLLNPSNTDGAPAAANDSKRSKSVDALSREDENLGVKTQKASNTSLLAPPTSRS